MHDCLDRIRTMTQSGPFSEQVVEFWLGKAVDWGQAVTSTARADVRAHLGKLRIFLGQLLHQLQATRSTSEAMRAFPFAGQFLGRLCWNPCVSADGESLDHLLQCLWCLYSTDPRNVVERRANQWIRNLLYHLSVEEKSGSAATVVRRSGCTPTDQRLKFLKNMVVLLEKEVRRSTALEPTKLRAPLIGALLQHPTACDRADLSQDFLEAVSAALLGKQLVLDEQAAMSLWSRSLPSLEGATLNLVESALSNPLQSPPGLDRQVTDSLLPKVSALHCPVFLVVCNIFRMLLVETQGSPTLRMIVQSFTRCFLQSLQLLEPQERLSLRVFFPQAPQSLLTPLLQVPSDVPEEAWPEHLQWISHSLQKVVGEEDEEDGNVGRWRCGVFESWFLLVQAGYWVDVAAQLLITAGPEIQPALLWLLAFYHHPTDLVKHRDYTLVMTRETLNHLDALFLAPPPLPPKQLGALEQRTSTCPHLLLHLLLNFAVFSPGPLSTVSEVTGKVLQHTGLYQEAGAFLVGVEQGLSRQAPPDPRAETRLKTIQETLALQGTV
ncbi:hypothetical protein AGOR_G00046220 [Albula goreensis]|uniref:FA complementation group C n=1 Tax=Albula goreensis TaxID=1534307 RepID=A0A8T3DXC7_9TELE|nr:hypothetical protein AGOR_G00046220 [Albula goreensis]